MSDERNDPTTPTATLQIYNFIEDYLGRKEKDTHINRASAASRCHKQRWFQGKGYQGEEITPRTIVNFTLGDLSEHVVKYFILNGCVGEGKLYSEVDFGKPTGLFTIQNGREIVMYDQDDLITDVGEIKVYSHPDGWGKRNSDGKWELIEVKSAADFGFEQFKDEGPGDYLKQAHVCMRSDKGKSLEVEAVRFFYIKKNTGHLWDRLHAFDQSLWDETVSDYIISNQEAEPEAPYKAVEETFRKKPTGRMVLPWQCRYCAFVKHCKPEAEIEFKSGKPILVVKETS